MGVCVAYPMIQGCFRYYPPPHPPPRDLFTVANDKPVFLLDHLAFSRRSVQELLQDVHVLHGLLVPVLGGFRLARLLDLSPARRAIAAGCPAGGALVSGVKRGSLRSLRRCCLR